MATPIKPLDTGTRIGAMFLNHVAMSVVIMIIAAPSALMT